MYNVLLWNFSSSAVQVDLALTDAPGTLVVRPILFDAATPHSDENARLKPERPIEFKGDKSDLTVQLEPYGMRFWWIER